MFGRRKMAALAAEFMGTGALTLLVLSVQRSTIGVPFFVAAAAGLSLAFMAFVFGGYTSGYFNPALTFGFWTARKIDTVTTVLYIAMQMLGAWGAYYLYTYFVNNPLQPVGGDYSARILVAEALGAAILSMGVAAAAASGLTRAATSAYAGLSLMLGMVAASSAAIGLLNPALALGTRAWVWGTYVLGPVLGAIIGSNIYAFLFATPDDIETTEELADSPAAVRKVNTRRATTKKAPAKRKTTTTRGSRARR